MTPNVHIVEQYMEGFRRTDRPAILACLAEDVVWEVPGLFIARGKVEFDRHIVDEGFEGQPVITLHRLIEAGDVVVAEGAVEARRVNEGPLHLVFCDVFEIRDGRIGRLVSYLMTVSQPASAASAPAPRR